MVVGGCHIATLVLLASVAIGGSAAAENRAVIVAAGSTPGFQADAVAQDFRLAGFATTAAGGLDAGQLLRPFEALTAPDPSPGARVVVLAGSFVSGGNEVWLMGGDARRPGLLNADREGIGLSRVVSLMRDGNGPRILMLAEVAAGDAPGARLRRGVGSLPAVAGVSVVAGPPGSVARGAQMLAAPNGSLGAVLAANPEIRVVSGPATGGVVISRGAGSGAVIAAGGGNTVAVPGAAGGLTQPAQPGEADAWVRAAALNTAESYRAFYDTFPAGRYAAVARDRLARLGAPVPDAPVASNAPQPADQPAAGPDRDAALTEIALNLSLGERSQIQRVLMAQGFDPGGSDGQFGRGTRDALRAWQGQAGLPQTGYVDNTTLRQLQQLAPR